MTKKELAKVEKIIKQIEQTIQLLKPLTDKYCAGVVDDVWDLLNKADYDLCNYLQSQQR